jgi:hypothetical protein
MRDILDSRLLVFMVFVVAPALWVAVGFVIDYAIGAVVEVWP